MKLCKNIFLSSIILSASFVFAENPVTMPTMPVVTMPTIGSGFYSPNSSNFYTGSKKSNSNNNEKQKASEENSVVAKDSSNIVMTETVQKKLEEEISKIAPIEKNPTSKNEYLTSNDINNLSSLGLFSSLSEIFGQKNAVVENNSNNLEKILSELNELKEKTDPNAKAVSFTNTNTVEKKVLRFSADKKDYLRFTKEVFFSNEEANGSFLFTGDLKYKANGKNREETFYMLFKTIGIEAGITKYDVSVSVSQDFESNTFLKRLAELSENEKLVANRTGNLVTLRLNNSDLKMDLLLALE